MELSKKNLKEYRLSYLRSLARELGVKSPTSLIKSDLIDRIIDVSNGTISPTSVSSGRPPLKVFEMDHQVIIDKKTIASLKDLQKKCDLLKRDIQKIIDTINTNI